MILYFINILTVLYLVSRGDDVETATYKGAFQWMKRNFLGIVFVYTLTVLAVIGGFILFIIPGFIVLVTLYFSQYIYVVEGKRGMSALVRSRALVKGHWFEVLKKIVGLTAYFFVPVFFVSLLVGMVSGVYPLDQYVLAGEMLLQVAAAFFTVMSMQVMFRLYRELATRVPDEPSKKGVHFIYWGLAVMGLITIPALLIATIMFNGISNVADSVPLPTEDTQLVFQMDGLNNSAKNYGTTQGTYEGVCAELTTVFSVDTEVTCNDSVDSWALSASQGEQRWCIDGTQTVPKRIQAEIGERTSCIAVE
jgi:hypothetical protein